MVSIKGGRKRVVTGAASTLTAGLALGAFALGGTADGATDAGAAARGTRVKPTVVLEHGAFADGSSWNGVIAGLRADGYPVVAAANPLRGPASDAAALRTVLGHIKGPKVLVGHSYGGNVISEAAVGDPDVKALVYVAAFLPAPGDRAGAHRQVPGLHAPRRPGPGHLSAGRRHHSDRPVHPAGQVPPPVRRRRTPGQAALMAAEQRPIAQAALEEKATAAAWKTKPSWDIVTTEDLNIPVAAQRFMAKRARAHTTEVAASHSVAVSHPHLVTDVIERAARATVR
ncbi:alpha/beta fold hydrolase [Streptomyces nogalater]